MNAPERPYTQQHPELGTGPISTEPNISPEYYQREQEQLFKKCWLNVGHLQEVPKKGDYMVWDLEVLNASVLIVHGKDDQIRAFHNACTHRGNKVAQGRGNSKGFACGFHGWTFNTEGDLAFVPDETQFFDLDKQCLGLKEINCDVWNGAIFINMMEQPRETLADWMSDYDDTLGKFPFEEMELMGCWSADVGVSWKVFVDAFQESYHVGFVHARSVPDGFATKENPYCRVPGFRLYDYHRAATCPANPKHNLWPSEDVAMKQGMMSLTGGGVTAETYPGTNPQAIPDFGFDINVIFPNFFQDVSNGWFFSYNFWPTAHNRTLWQVKLFTLKPKPPADLVAAELTKIVLRDAIREDLNTMESTQQGLDSKAIDTVMLSDQELACRHQYAVVENFMNRD